MSTRSKIGSNFGPVGMLNRNDAERLKQLEKESAGYEKEKMEMSFEL